MSFDTLSRLSAYPDCPKNIKEQTVVCLGREFYGFKDSEKGATKFRIDLDSGVEKGILFHDGCHLQAVMTRKEYQYSQISPQLFIEAETEDKKITRLRLQPFSDLLTKENLLENYDKAIEVAYIYVPPEFRGQRLSSELFSEHINQILKYPQADKNLLFTIARGIYAQSDIQTNLTQYLLNQEKLTNGCDSNEKVKVTGTWVPVEDVSKATSFDLSIIGPETGAEATIHLFKKIKAKFIGFAKNMSPVWSANSASLFS